MDILKYIHLFKKWLWLIVLTLIVFGAGGYLFRASQPPVYQASTKLLIGGFFQSPNLDSSRILTGIQLAKTYAELVNTNEILQSIIEEYHLPLSPEQLKLNTQTIIRGDTSILEITVTYSDPEIVAQMTDGLAEQLILKSAASPSNDQQTQIAFLESELPILNELLTGIRKDLKTINQQLADPLLSSGVNNLTQERLTLTNQSIQVSATITQVLNTLAALNDNTNTLEIVDHARVPANPVGVSKWVVAVLGAIVGALIAGGGVIVWDELDTTVKTVSDARSQLELPVLSSIPKFNASRVADPQSLITLQNPMSPASEAFRMLQTSLLFGQNKSSYSYIVTSAGANEGKSIIAANLAAAMALSGLRVLLIDTNLLNPQLHKIFSLSNRNGLTTLLSIDSTEKQLTEVERLDPKEIEHNLLQTIQQTAITNLSLLSTGPLEDTTDISSFVLLAHKFKEWVDILRTNIGIDLVIFDTPSCLTSGESLMLVSVLQADVLLVIEAGKTRRDQAQEAIEKFIQIGHSIRGIVFNKN